MIKCLRMSALSLVVVLMTSCGDAAKPSIGAPGSQPGVVAEKGSDAELKYAVDYVIQAEHAWQDGDKEGARKLYDQAIKRTESEGNPVQAKTYRKRLAELEARG